MLLLASAVVFFDSIFFTLLAPLLPSYQERFGLSKTEAGFLTAAYALGALIAAVPAGLFALRRGVRATVLLGLGLLVIGSLILAVAGNLAALGSARLIQGAGCAVAWTGALTWLVAVGPPSRRGELLGLALGAAVAGSLMGPALGALAARFGAAPTFAPLALLGIALMVMTSRTIAPGPVADRLSSLSNALRNRTTAAGAYLLLLSALLLGGLFVLAPLQLDDLGWSPTEIAACFLISSVVTMLATPAIGQWSDRHGRAPVIRGGLSVSLLVSLGLAADSRPLIFGALVVAAGVAYSSMWAPGTALLSDGAERAGISLVIGFVLFNLAWAPGFLAGSAVGGWLASTASNSLAYLTLGLLCATTLGAGLIHAGSGGNS